MRAQRKPKEVCKDPKKASAMSVALLSNKYVSLSLFLGSSLASCPLTSLLLPFLSLVCSSTSSIFSPTIRYEEFEQFVYCYDMHEALQHFIGSQGIDVNIEQVQKVDVNQFANSQQEGPKLVYRDYPDD